MFSRPGLSLPVVYSEKFGEIGDSLCALMSLFQSRILSRSLHRRQGSSDGDRRGTVSPPAEGVTTPTVTTTIIPPPASTVKEVTGLGLFGAYSSSSESEDEDSDDSVEEMQDEQDVARSADTLADHEVCRDVVHRPSVGGRMGKLRSMVAGLVGSTIEATQGGRREKALAAAPWPVREQVGRLQGLLGDDKTSAQWRQLDCRLGDCLEEAKLSMTRLAETTAHGLALYLQDGQPKIPQPRGRSVELAATSSESITSDISESPVPSSVEEEEETPSAAVYSRAPEIDEDVLKRMAENRVDEVERELEALAAVHEREQRKEEEEEEDFPIDGFKLGVGEVEERSSKWACKPHEESDDEDRRRWIFTRTPRVHLKDPNRAADRSTHGLVGRWTSIKRRRSGAAAAHY